MNSVYGGFRRRVAALAAAAGLALAAAVAPGLGCGDSGAAPTDGGELFLKAAPETRLRVRTERVRRDRLSDVDRVTGTVRAFHHATLTAEARGQVESRAVEAGARVEAGSLLIELESSRQEIELRRAEASLEAVRTVLAHAERELARGERLMRESVLSQQRRDDLQHAVDRARDELALARVARDSAERDLADTRIRAPFAGTLDAIEVDVGDYVVPGTPVATLVDLSRMRLFAGVTAKEAARLEPGLTARVSFADLGGRSFEAILKSVGRVADEAEGTYPIELWLEDTDDSLRAGLVARIDLPDPSQEEVLLAPRAALLRRGGRSEAFVVEEEGERSVARSRVLRTGRNDGQWIEILEGLEEGDAVVIDGHFALEDGSRVVIDGGRSPGPAAPDPVGSSDRRESSGQGVSASASASVSASASGPRSSPGGRE